MKKSTLRLLAVLVIALLLAIPLISSFAAVDDSYTKVLLHMDGPQDSNTFIDDSGKNWSTFNHAKITRTDQIIGIGSGVFDGTDDYITSPDNSDFDFGTGNWTVDFWIKLNGSKAEGLLSTRAQNGTGWLMDLDATRHVRYIWNSIAKITSSDAVTDATWTHIALVRNANTITLYINGSSEGTDNCTGDQINSNGVGLAIGRNYANYTSIYFIGGMDEMRISKGIARWTEAFTPNNSQYEPTSTPTITPTGTLFTPSITPTNTPTYTPSPTHTPTPTLTITPNPNIDWAPSSISITGHMQNALASALYASPPSGVIGSLYGLLGADGDGSGGWYISLAALTGVSPPYTGWDILTDSVWMSSLHCTGSEPAWTCDYYLPAYAMNAQDATGLVFPWQPGTWARYGNQGIHHDNGTMLPGDSAVDFFGDDGWDGSMPPAVYAAAAGTVISHCDGVHNGGIVVDGASGRFMYFHLLPGQSKMAVGTSLQQGERIGELAHGSFNDSPCGSASQGAAQYHIHFAFLPEGGYFQIGGCSLDLGSGSWLCGSDTVFPGGDLANGGEPGPGPTPGPGTPTITPGGPTLTPVPGGGEGGQHIWNGPLTALVGFFSSIPPKIFPTHTPIGLYDWFDRFYASITDFAWLFAASGLIWIVPGITVWGIIVLLETVRWIYAAWRLLAGLPFIGWLE
jgi:hypothetical protein